MAPTSRCEWTDVPPSPEVRGWLGLAQVPEHEVALLLGPGWVRDLSMAQLLDRKRGAPEPSPKVSEFSAAFVLLYSEGAPVDSSEQHGSLYSPKKSDVCVLALTSAAWKQLSNLAGR